MTEIKLPLPIPAATTTPKIQRTKKNLVGICISVTFYTHSNLGAHKIWHSRENCAKYFESISRAISSIFYTTPCVVSLERLCVCVCAFILFFNHLKSLRQSSQHLSSPYFRSFICLMLSFFHVFFCVIHKKTELNITKNNWNNCIQTNCHQHLQKKIILRTKAEKKDKLLIQNLTVARSFYGL